MTKPEKNPSLTYVSVQAGGPKYEIPEGWGAGEDAQPSPTRLTCSVRVLGL